MLLFVDNIFRFTQAGSEVSALLGRIPSAVGYQPTLSPRWARSRSASPRRTRAPSPRCRRSTSPPTTSPTRRRRRRSPTSTRTTVLFRRRRARHLPGRRPARLDLDASSIPGVVGPTTTASPARSSDILQRYKDLQDIIAILGMDELSEDDKLAVIARPQDPALPLATLLSSPGSSPASRRQVGPPGRPSAASGDPRQVR